ncbi:uncharacterized protein METZ01_LOCUS247265, partial [marine metagenome]
ALQKTATNLVETLGDTEKGVTDDAGNIGPSADTYTYTFTYDDEIPEVDITAREDANPSNVISEGSFYNGGGAVEILFEWNEVLDSFESDANPAQIRVSIGGAILNPIPASIEYINDGSYIYTLTIPDATFNVQNKQGLVNIDVIGPKIKDIAGNSGSGTTSFSFTYDNVPPVPTNESVNMESPTSDQFPRIRVSSDDNVSSGAGQVTVRALIVETELQGPPPPAEVYLSKTQDVGSGNASLTIGGDGIAEYLYLGTAGDFNSLDDHDMLDGWDHALTLVFSDLAGNEAQLEDVFTIDRTAPDTDGDYSLGDNHPGVGYQITGIELNDENGIYYWNSFHNQITVTVSTLPPIDNDVSILGGSIRLMAKVGDGSYLPLGNSQSISEDENDYPTQFLFTVQNTNLSGTGFEQLTGLDEGSIVSIAAVIYDAAENGSTPSASDNISLTVDQESPISG